MSKTTCGNCKHFLDYENRMHPCVWRKPTGVACKEFEQKTQTVFDQITSSSEVLAVKSVYAHECCRIPDGATSPFIDEIFWFDDEKGDTWDERFDSAWKKAIVATMAKLKEVVE